jgi:DNA-binding transcriptional regulator YdaS (Cro superfamily)
MAAAEAADEGTTFQDLADAIGVSKTLIQQLVSKGRHLAASRASEAAKAIMAGKA